MNPLIVLWFTVMIGIPEYNIAPACGESGDPTAGPVAHLYTFETVEEDKAIVAKSKSSGSIGGVYFMTQYQCNKHLAKYDAIWRKDKYGE